MKITAFLLLAACLTASARGLAQRVTLDVKDAPLKKVFNEISKQTGVSILCDEAVLNGSTPVTLHVNNIPVNDALQACFRNQPLSYRVVNNTIVVERAAAPKQANLPPPPNEVHGRVTDSTGAPLANASVIIKGTKRGTQTDASGKFDLKYTESNITLVISYTGYQGREYEVNNEDNVLIVLKAAANSLEEVVINKGYYSTTQRLNTGDVTKITSKEIEQQPVPNVLAALEGRVPGMIIQQTTGVPGGAINVQIRGLNSLKNGTNPFIVIDGVPYNSVIPSPPSYSSGLINAVLQGGSPLSFINPSDIESVEVLKDADATAIYGSRAANGAILITTKKGKSGDMRINLRAYSGFSSLAHDMDFMNTQQYLAMRHEAFKNDGTVPSSTDYDINGTWDTTRYTNWSKVLTGNTAYFTDAQVSVSGGGNNTQYLIGAGYNRQTTGIPRLLQGDGADEHASVHFNLNGASKNKKFKIGLTGSFVSDVNTANPVDFGTARLNTAPDAPAIFNADGTLNWAPLSPGEAGTWVNPYSYLYNKYKGVTNNLVANSVVSYSFLPNLEFRTSFGYNITQTNEIQTAPIKSNDPGWGVTSGSSTFNTINTHSWIVEPLLEYKLRAGKGQLAALAGGSFNNMSYDSKRIFANGYISDALLENLQAAPQISSVVGNTEYKYNAVFGRLSYDWDEKYLVNVTARRDGSSRFGPGKQFANFGAVGVGWVFTGEKFFQRNVPFLSFGKLRASYGTTGNDQVGDYRFLDLYSTTRYTYNGSIGLVPTSLFNPNLAWERTKKLEAGIELGFLKDRINLQASWYKNRSDNQLVTSQLSLVTGFSQIAENLHASIQNSGIEIVLNTTNVKTKHFDWSTSFNISTWQNKLLAFDNLASSPYSSLYVIGQPITIKQLYKYAGVNDTTGAYQFYTSKGDITYYPNSLSDRTAIINPVPRYYGGIQNRIRFKGVTLDFLFQFVKQIGVNYTGSLQVAPGWIGYQQPAVYYDNHWQKPGDNKMYQQFTQTYSVAGSTIGYIGQSTFAYSDASFIRLKNVAVSYDLPGSWKQKMKLENFRIFAQGQNLVTFTKYFGIDPESQGTGLPPLRTWTLGLEATF